MKNWHPAVTLIVFAAMLALVAGGTFLLGRLVRASKVPTAQHAAPAVTGVLKQ